MNELIEKLESEFPLTKENSLQMIDIKNSEYSFALTHVVSLLEKTHSKICVITFSRSGKSLLKEFEENKIKTEKTLILSGVAINSSSPNIKSFDKPWETNSVKECISFAIKNFAPEVFVFDSVTSLSLFLSKEEISFFTQKFSEILKARGIKAVFFNLLSETPDDIAVQFEGFLDQRISLERFMGEKISVKPAKTEQPKQKAVAKNTLKKQEVNSKEMKKGLSALIKEEAKKIADETIKNLELEHEEKEKQLQRKLLEEKQKTEKEMQKKISEERKKTEQEIKKKEEALRKEKALKEKQEKEILKKQKQEQQKSKKNRKGKTGFLKKVFGEKPAKEKFKEVHLMEKEREKQNLLRKLELLERSFDSGLISKKAFEEGRSQIEAKLKDF
ncbi:hypothetical protein KKG83_05965 [Candidatus Micrarchaeota archaeon]|nr:hypothetical protein [Candidatus Micrarchaeota archaeon]